MFLKQLKASCKQHHITFFCDNGSCFKAKDTKRAANDLGITLIYNLPYRPDINGMENVWTHVKAAYTTKKT